MSKFLRWSDHEAKWYQFWWPNSGTAGGVIFGLFLGGVVSLILLVGRCL